MKVVLNNNKLPVSNEAILRGAFLWLLFIFLGAYLSLTSSFDQHLRYFLSYAVCITILVVYFVKRRNLSSRGFLIIVSSFFISGVLYKVSWLPHLSKSFDIYTWFEDFDPVRIYIYSRELLLNDFTPIVTWDFSGIFYVYGVLMYVGSFDPFILTIFHFLGLILSVFFLMATLNRMRIINSTVLERRMLLVFILPEVMYYMNLSSKDTFLLITITLYLTLLLRFFYFEERKLIAFIGILILAGISATVRGLTIPFIALSFLCAYITTGKYRRLTILESIIAILLLVLFVCFVVLYWGSIVEYYKIKSGITEGYEESSFGKIFVTDNVILQLLYAPIRLLVFVAAPISQPIDWNPSSYALGYTLTEKLTSIIYVLLFPYAISQVVWSFRNLKVNNKEWTISVFFIFLELLLSNGTSVIHPRYRVMATVVFWLMIVMGMRLKTSFVKPYFIVWGIMLMGGAFVYLIYKLSF